MLEHPSELPWGDRFAAALRWPVCSDVLLRIRMPRAGATAKISPFVRPLSRACAVFCDEKMPRFALVRCVTDRPRSGSSHIALVMFLRAAQVDAGQISGAHDPIRESV